MKSNSNKKAIKRGALALVMELGKKKKKLRQERNLSDRLDTELEDVKGSLRNAEKAYEDQGKDEKLIRERVNMVQKRLIELRDALDRGKVSAEIIGGHVTELNYLVSYLDLEQLDAPF